MSNRRMFSKKIITSARFLKMPLSTQALYFHLGLNADDDGVVEAFTVVRLVGSSDDDFKILIAKNFIVQLNDEQVCFVVDWLEHNTIRADRKIDSIYKGLLMQTIDKVALIESKPRADRQKKADSGTSQGHKKDGISKDKLSKDKLSKDKLSKENIDITKIYDFWNNTTGQNLRGDKAVTKNLEKILKDYTVDDVHAVINFIKNDTWYKQTGQVLLSVVARVDKFSEKLDRANNSKIIQQSALQSLQDKNKNYMEGVEYDENGEIRF